MTPQERQPRSALAFAVSCGVCSGLLYVSRTRLCRRRARSHRWAVPSLGNHALQTSHRSVGLNSVSPRAADDSLQTSSVSASQSVTAVNQNALEFDTAGILKGNLLHRAQVLRTSRGPSDETNADAGSSIKDEKTDDDSDFARDKSQRVFLVDGFGILYRSYYALVKTTMSSKDMFDTRAVYGFTNVLLSLLQKHVKGNPVIVVFDGQKKPGQVDHRTAQYPEYKSDRGPTPAGVIAAIPWVKRLVRALGLCTIEQNLFEADDVIGTLVRRAKRAGIFSVIVSIDKDFRQLLDRDFVSILKPGSNSRPFEYVTEDTFRAEYSDLHPTRYVDVLTLIGDAADSIKGVPGIGPRTAPKLIKHFGSLEGLLDAARSIEEQDKRTKNEIGQSEKKGAKKSKAEGKSMLRTILPKRHAKSLTFYEQRTLMMKNMVTIRDNVNLPDFSWKDFRRRQVQGAQVKEIARLLEFTSSRLLSRMLHSADDVPQQFLNCPQFEKCNPKEEYGPVVSADTEQLQSASVLNGRNVSTEGRKTSSADTSQALAAMKYEVLVDDNAIERALGEISSTIGLSMVVANDESGGKSMLAGIAFSGKPGHSVFIDCNGREQLPDALVQILSDPAIEKVGWFMKENAKALLSSYNVFLQGRLFDVRIAVDLVHAGQRLTDASLASIYLWEGALKSWLSDGKMKQLSCPEKPEDALALSDLGFQTAQKLKEGLHKDKLDRVAEQVEFPLIPVLAEMEINGVPCRADELSLFETHVKARLCSVEKSLRRAIPKADDPEARFRPTSRDDVARLLFETWKLPIKVKPSASGKYPANKKVLSMVANDQGIASEKREFAKLMIEHREVSKILNTYTRSLINAIHPDGRIRTTFVQDASYSGRLSTSRPNLQSIPSRSQLGRKVRSTVIAEDGFSILCADYSQIELRIIASLSGDETLRAAFADGVDVHTAVAGRIFGVKDVSKVTKEQRAKAKEVSYGIPYGISAHGLAQQLGVPQRDARDLIAGFHAQFPGVKAFTQELVEKARRDGFAQTLFGRKLRLPLLLHGGPQERRAAERVAVNMPIQGTQADMIKLAMVRIAARLRAAGAKSKLILQVHDELVLEVHDAEREAVRAAVEEEMENALPLEGVRVVVDVGFGESWLSCASH